MFFVFLHVFKTGGSLYHVLHISQFEISLETRLSIVRQVVAGLAFIHANDIVHNDIKAHNILV